MPKPQPTRTPPPARRGDPTVRSSRRAAPPGRPRRSLWSWTWAAPIAGIVGLVGILVWSGVAGASATGASTGIAYQVGSPGPGQAAPPIKLQSTAGGTFSLAAEHGHSVLLFFQEGVDCEPCWTQMTDIKRDWSSFRQLGVSQLVTITPDPVAVLRQKVAEEGITTPVLADPDNAIANAYGATEYGMHPGTSGHSFVLVGPTGRIEWRGDFGGAPDYTMYVPVANLITDLGRAIHHE